MENAAKKRRSEKEGIFNFTKEMISALLMAFIAIVYVIQAFKIPTGSMEESLKVGDFLLGLKFIYGAPVFPKSYTKFPGVTSPKPGDVVIFKYPGSDKKDYIKRCVAGPGQTIEIKGKKVIVDDIELKLPPKGKYDYDGMSNLKAANFSKLRIPRKGDTLYTENCPVREFLFLKHLIHQENPRKKVSAQYDLYIDSMIANNQPVLQSYGMNMVSFNEIQPELDNIDNWINISDLFEQIETSKSDHLVEIRKKISLDGKPVYRYIVKYDNYFMMGDNRDNSMDSRFWGYVNRNFIKAKAFILYFSLNKETPYILLPLKIRWNRIGKLIRSWDGLDHDKK